MGTNTTRNKNFYLLKNIFVFGISIVATKLITFFLVPLYTHCLSTHEFGIVDLLFSIGNFLIPLCTLNISDAIYRFSMDKNSNMNKITSIMLILLIFCSLISLIFIPLLSFFPNYSEYKIYYYIYLVTTAFSQVLSANLKGQEKLKKLSIANTLSTAFVAIFNLIFLLGFKMKIEGYFLAFIISNILVSIYAFISGEVHKGIKNFVFDKELFKSMTKYSIVLVPTSLMWWIINSSDRIMISNFINETANGIYAISYKIPSFFTTILSIFTSAWVFSAIKNKDEEDNESYSKKMFNTLVFTTILFSILIIVFLKPFLKIYVSKDYFYAWHFVPPLLVGSIFLTLSNFLSAFYSAYKDSKGILFSGLYAAIVNIVLNYFLIKKIGLYGASISTGISYFLVFIYRIMNIRKYIIINISKKNIFSFIILIISIIILYFEISFEQIIEISLLLMFLLFFRKDLSNFAKTALTVLKNKKQKGVN